MKQTTENSQRETFLRVLYLAGPGDVVNTYRHWKRGEYDPTQIALTYSGLFYDVCRHIGAKAFVVSTNPRRDRIDDGDITIVQFRPLFHAGPSVLYHLGQLFLGLRLLVIALRFRPNVAVLGGVSDWFWLCFLRWTAVKIVPTLHSAFWPARYRPIGLKDRLIQRLNGWFWGQFVDATICVSPECERQVRVIAPTIATPIHQARAQYERQSFSGIKPATVSSPLSILFVGRIERNKGVFDLLEIAARLEQRLSGRFLFELCGDGGAFDEIRSEIRRRRLERQVTLSGYMMRPHVLEAYSRSHVVIVPTTSNFSEGLNKVSVESILAGRPVVTSRLSNAIDILDGAVCEVSPGDIEAYCRMLIHLADDEEFYTAKVKACANVREQFFERDRGWGAALLRCLPSECITRMN